MPATLWGRMAEGGKQSRSGSGRQAGPPGGSRLWARCCAWPRFASPAPLEPVEFPLGTPRGKESLAVCARLSGPFGGPQQPQPEWGVPPEERLLWGLLLVLCPTPPPAGLSDQPHLKPAQVRWHTCLTRPPPRGPQRLVQWPTLSPGLRFLSLLPGVQGGPSYHVFCLTVLYVKDVYPAFPVGGGGASQVSWRTCSVILLPGTNGRRDVLQGRSQKTCGGVEMVG